MSIGATPIRLDATDKVTGAATYPADRFPDDALVGKVVFTNQPHARLTRLDTAPAEALPGVVAVLTGRDVPVNEYGLTHFDQPVFISIEHTGRSEVPPRSTSSGSSSRSSATSTQRSHPAPGCSTPRTVSTRTPTPTTRSARA